jgi:hypothetical protein
MGSRVFAQVQNEHMEEGGCDDDTLKCWNCERILDAE